jgi:hypothetical protein
MQSAMTDARRMRDSASSTLPGWGRSTLVAGSTAGLVGSAVLLWRGLSDSGAAAAPFNAVSHWLWGRTALHRNAPSWRYTALGAATNFGASFFWAALHALLKRRTPAQAALGAIGVSALAAVVDLRVVPERLTPGFEHRLSQRSLLLFYTAFAAGLLLGSALEQRRR